MSSEGSEYVVNLREKSPQLLRRSAKSTSMLAGCALQSAIITNEMSSFSKVWRTTFITFDYIVAFKGFPEAIQNKYDIGNFRKFFSLSC